MSSHDIVKLFFEGSLDHATSAILDLSKEEQEAIPAAFYHRVLSPYSSDCGSQQVLLIPWRKLPKGQKTITITISVLDSSLLSEETLKKVEEELSLNKIHVKISDRI